PGQVTGSAVIAGRVTDDRAGVAALLAALVDHPPVHVRFDTAGNFSFNSPAAGGPHTAHLRATDQAGNASGVLDVSFTLDNQPPTVNLQSPGPSDVTASTRLTGQVSDDRSGVASL